MVYVETHEYFHSKHYFFGSAIAKMFGDGFMCMDVSM
jgi:hypothetical protein